MATDTAYLEERIAQTKALIIAYEDAILALAADGILSYTLDTGLTRQIVTKQDVTLLTRTLGLLEQRLDAYCARLYGGQCIIRPGY